MIEYVVALGLTLLVEAPLVAWALARWYRVPWPRGALLGVAGSLLTHPIVWWLLPGLLLPSVGQRGYLLTAEGFAWLVEAAIFWLAVGWLGGRRDGLGLLLVSLTANLASFGLGAALQLSGLW